LDFIWGGRRRFCRPAFEEVSGEGEKKIKEFSGKDRNRACQSAMKKKKKKKQRDKFWTLMILKYKTKGNKLKQEKKLKKKKEKKSGRFCPKPSRIFMDCFA